MSKLQLARGEMIYMNQESGVKIYKGKILSSDIPVAIKEFTFTRIPDVNHVMRETFTMARLKHPGILKVFDCYFDQVVSGTFTVNIVMELMETDLHQEIEKRKQAGQVWNEGELWAMTKKLASALSCAEKEGISHRDIKPQNVFVTETEMKIGDFGSSTQHLSLSPNRRSVQGSPFYLSPELKRAFMQFMATGKEDQEYDPIKSDVYSLGVTLMEMAYLEAPGGLTNLNELETETEKLIAGLSQYQWIQILLKSMLRIDSTARPSFSEIEKWMEDVESYYSSLEAQPSPASEPVAMVQDMTRSDPGVQYRTVLGSGLTIEKERKLNAYDSGAPTVQPRSYPPLDTSALSYPPQVGVLHPLQQNPYPNLSGSYGNYPPQQYSPQNRRGEVDCPYHGHQVHPVMSTQRYSEHLPPHLIMQHGHFHSQPVNSPPPIFGNCVFLFRYNS